MWASFSIKQPPDFRWGLVVEDRSRGLTCCPSGTLRRTRQEHGQETSASDDHLVHRRLDMFRVVGELIKDLTKPFHGILHQNFLTYYIRIT